MNRTPTGKSGINITLENNSIKTLIESLTGQSKGGKSAIARSSKVALQFLDEKTRDNIKGINFKTKRKRGKGWRNIVTRKSSFDFNE